jgi:hypothetical protein
MSREAMKLALEALETGINHGVAVDKLRRAIEQAEKQEPVAFKTLSKIGKAVGYWRADLVPPHIRPDSHDITPLYTAPPRQPWVGLTEEEILNFGPGQPDAVWSYEDQLYFARAIDAALRRKNEPR